MSSAAVVIDALRVKNQIQDMNKAPTSKNRIQDLYEYNEYYFSCNGVFREIETLNILNGKRNAKIFVTLKLITNKIYRIKEIHITCKTNCIVCS